MSFFRYIVFVADSVISGSQYDFIVVYMIRIFWFLLFFWFTFLSAFQPFVLG